MRYLILFALMISTALAAEKPEEPVPTMPDEVTLTTGRVLRKVQVVRWEKDRVVLKHAAGADPIAFSLFKSPAPGDLPAMQKAFEFARDAEFKKQRNEAKADLERQRNQASVVKYDGQAFIVTRGAGNYKLGGVVVRVYLKPLAEIRNTLKWSSSRPEPDAIATVDAEGKFSFTAPPTGPVTLVARARRLAGSTEEIYLWIVDADAGANRFEPRLSNDNLEPEPTNWRGI